MRRVLLGAGCIVGLAAVLALAHLALIEIGREVVTLRTQRADGSWQETRLWIVDDGESSWLHSAGESWVTRFEGNPVVELERGGEILRYRAHAVPGPHAAIDRLLREKYGLADRWVRLIAPCNEGTVPVRLDPAGGPGLASPILSPHEAPTAAPEKRLVAQAMETYGRQDAELWGGAGI